MRRKTSRILVMVFLMNCFWPSPAVFAISRSGGEKRERRFLIRQKFNAQKIAETLQEAIQTSRQGLLAVPSRSNFVLKDPDTSQREELWHLELLRVTIQPRLIFRLPLIFNFTFAPFIELHWRKKRPPGWSNYKP